VPTVALRRCEPFASCHSERSEESLAQGKLSKAISPLYRMFDVAPRLSAAVEWGSK